MAVDCRVWFCLTVHPDVFPRGEAVPVQHVWNLFRQPRPPVPPHSLPPVGHPAQARPPPKVPPVHDGEDLQGGGGGGGGGPRWQGGG